MEEFIQLKKDNVCRIKVKDQEGKERGVLEFDLEDIELPIRYEKMFEMHRQNESWARHQLLIIDKKQDVPGKVLSKNEMAKLKVIKEFYLKDMKALDMFLGEGKTQMILDIMGRKPYLSMFDDIGEALTPINKILEENSKITEEKIKDKYKIETESIIE
ncbi:MAG: hypothetical protein J6S67_05785 [Methanobrevibacter sp.]|nr:hypothetical protein [Methanobrevibacter sp.]